MAERTLAQRELNRALLSRQILLERSTLPLERLDRGVAREVGEADRLADLRA